MSEGSHRPGESPRVRRRRFEAGAWLGGHLIASAEPSGTSPWRGAGLAGGLVAAALVVIFAALGVSVLAVGGIAEGLSAAVKSGRPPQAAAVGALAPAATGTTVIESMTIDTGKMDGRPGWPRFTNPYWTVRAGETVVLRITNYDDGTAPLTGSQTMFDAVQGTVSGQEYVDGRALRSMPPADVSHTFTVVGLGLNLPIPAAPQGGKVTVVARFVVQRAWLRGNRAVTFVWQCYGPCGSGPNAMGGAMATAGWMEGKIRVLA